MRPFDSEKAGGAGRICRSPFHVLIQIGGALDYRQLPVRSRSGVAEPACLIERPFFQAGPTCNRPALRNRQQSYAVRPVAVAFDVQSDRCLRHDRECLQGHVPFNESRYIDMTSGIASQKISVPQERIGVKVDDEKTLMQFPGSIRWRVKRRPSHSVEPAVDHAGEDEKEGAEPDEQKHCGGDHCSLNQSLANSHGVFPAPGLGGSQRAR